MAASWMPVVGLEAAAERLAQFGVRLGFDLHDSAQGRAWVWSHVTLEGFQAAALCLNATADEGTVLLPDGRDRDRVRSGSLRSETHHKQALMEQKNTQSGASTSVEPPNASRKQAAA